MGGEGEREGFPTVAGVFVGGRGKARGGGRVRSETAWLDDFSSLPLFLCGALFLFPLVKERIGWKLEGR